MYIVTPLDIRACVVVIATVSIGITVVMATANEFGEFADDVVEQHEKMKYLERMNVNGNENGMDHLIRREGVKIGHVEKVVFEDNKSVEVITRSFRPLLFEIADFLTDEECDHIIERAKDPNEGGMFTSTAKGGLTTNVTYVPEGVNGRSLGPLGLFWTWDCIIGEGLINVDEIIETIHVVVNIILLKDDVIQMFEAVGQSEILSDGFITKEEFDEISTLAIEQYVDNLWKTHPRFKTRTSEQAWLFMEQWIDPTIHNIREKLVKLTGLSRRIIYGGEQLQVVHYEPYGHYHAHHDSETHLEDDIPCCHQYDGDTLNSTGECKICRFITFIMYLNDVEEGGDTAFPMADDEKEYDADKIRGNVTFDKYNLSHGCKHANLIIQPKKGKAVLWYNHLLNETDGWMGELDLYSLHGGCDVIKGEKWISNMWITAPFGKAKDIDSIFLNKKDYLMAEGKYAHDNNE